jgi:ArsR family transcriptional regulator, arsenate/arsenite/antimonite-responsive transcriptional repressor
MAVNKKEQFCQEEMELADFAKAIAHPARIAILKQLAEKETCICGEIVEVLPLAQSTVSQHIKELREAGLVTGTSEGPRSCYCINWRVFDKFAEAFGRTFGNIKDKQNKCC